MITDGEVKGIERLWLIISVVFLSGGAQLIFFDSGARNLTESGNFFAQIPFVFAYIYGLYFAIRWPALILGWCRDNFLVVLILLCCIVSSFWSLDPGGTIRRSMLLVATTLFGIAFCLRCGLKESSKIACLAFLILFTLFCFSLFSGVGVHQDEHYPAVRGFFYHKNIAARVFCLGFLLGLYLFSYKDMRFLSCSTMAACFFGVFMTLSVTGIVTIILIVASYWIVGFMRLIGRNLFLLFVFFVLLIVPIGYEFFYSLLESTVGFAGRDMTLTGRTQIWSVSISEVISRSPFLGFGYESFWTSDEGALSADWDMWMYTPQHSHNGLIQTFVSLGFLGVALVSIMIYRFMGRAFRCSSKRKERQSKVYFSFFVYFLMVNFSEWSILAPSSIIWTYFVIMYTSLSRDSNY